jgi:hypothetical protein
MWFLRLHLGPSRAVHQFLMITVPRTHKNGTWRGVRPGLDQALVGDSDPRARCRRRVPKQLLNRKVALGNREKTKRSSSGGNSSPEVSSSPCGGVGSSPSVWAVSSRVRQPEDCSRLRSQNQTPRSNSRTASASTVPAATGVMRLT